MAETIDLGLSNLCLDPRTAVFGGVDGHTQALEEIRGHDPSGRGYSAGYCITLTRALAWDMLERIQEGTFTNDLGDGRVFARRLEQSWGPGLPRGVLRGVGKMLSPIEAGKTVLLSAMMTPSARSLKIMQALSKPLGDPLVVVRPEAPNWLGRFPDFTPYDFARTGAQIKPGVFMKLAGVHPDSKGRLLPTFMEQLDLSRQLNRQGVHGFVVDGHWIQAEADRKPGVRIHPRAYLSAMAHSDSSSPVRWLGTANIPPSEEGFFIPIVGMHLAAGRRDSPNKADRVRSAAELAALDSDDPTAFGKTALGNIMAGAYHAWRWQLAHSFEGIQELSEPEKAQAVLQLTPPAVLPVDVEVNAQPGDTRQQTRKRLGRIAAKVHAFFDRLEDEWGNGTIRRPR